MRHLYKLWIIMIFGFCNHFSRRWNKYHSVRFTEITSFSWVLNQVTREVVWIELKEKDLVTEIITFEDVFVFSISRKNMSKFQQGKGLKMVSFFPELALRQCQCHFYTSISTQKIVCFVVLCFRYTHSSKFDDNFTWL